MIVRLTSRSRAAVYYAMLGLAVIGWGMSWLAALEAVVAWGEWNVFRTAGVVSPLVASGVIISARRFYAAELSERAVAILAAWVLPVAAVVSLLTYKVATAS